MRARTVIKKLLPKKVFHKIEPLGHGAEAVLLNVRYQFPARGLKVIGVTGSAGKTTTTILIASVLREAGYKTGYFTTVENDLGSGPEFNATRMTTVSASYLLNNIQRAKEAGIEWLVVETTSHALQQNRVWGIPYQIAVLTNFSHEHLDYHGTMEAYKAAKQKLFKIVGKRGGVAIVNDDDPSAKDFAKFTSKTLFYSKKHKADVWAEDVKTSAHGSAMVIHTKDAEMSVKTSLPGAFNVSNVLAAASVGVTLGLSPEVIAKGVASLPQVSGRMAQYTTSKGFTAIIDFAHTPDSFEKIFQEVRPLAKGKMTAVFGCAGERDTARRAIQGKLAADFCDRIILTEDDPRSEDNMAIIAQIKEGIAKSTKHPEVIVEPLREDAIDIAVNTANKGDVILLLSKGHEKSILLANGPKPWDEEKALKASLKKYQISLVTS